MTFSFTDEPIPIHEFLPILELPAIAAPGQICTPSSRTTSCSTMQPVFKMLPIPTIELV